MERLYYLYRIINTVNNKLYIGQTIEPTKRWHQHKRDAASPRVPFQYAIKKYGNDAFEFEIIATCKTQEEANELETQLVKQYESHISTNKGYNATWGGMNAPKTEEWKAHMSVVQTARSEEISEERKLWWANLNDAERQDLAKKISEANTGQIRPSMQGENNHFYGKQHSPEILEINRQAHLGKKHTEETKNKIGAASASRTYSEETCKKHRKHRLGKTWSDDIKQKMSLAKKGKSWKLVNGKRVWFEKESIS